MFVLTDDQRADAVGYHANSLLGIETPNIDRLAAEGARFNNMFATTSLCSPSRASFLSGTYTHTHGVRDNFTDYPHQLQSFPLLLQNAGYSTAYIGKWHMGEGDDSRRPGFDYWVTHKGQGKYYDTDFNVNGERKTVAGYYTDRVTDMALDWLASNRGVTTMVRDRETTRHSLCLKNRPSRLSIADLVQELVARCRVSAFRRTVSSKSDSRSAVSKILSS